MLLKEALLFVVLVAGVSGCPDGWTNRGLMCYKFEQAEVNYATARSVCEAAGGVVAMPKTKADLLDVVAVHKTSGSKSRIWIGVDDEQMEGTFLWNDGTILDSGSPSWRKGEPNNHGAGEDCVIVRTDGKLNDISCTKTFPMVCQRAYCPTGWTDKGNLCYKFTETKVNYATAQSLCKKAGGVVAMPKTKQDVLDVVAVLDRSKTRNKVWVGLDDFKTEGTFVWTDGTILAAGSPFWRKGEPNNHGAGEDCVIMRTDNKLNDISCTNKFSFVCQREICPAGWTSMGHKCYKFIDGKTTDFATARSLCKVAGGVVAMPKTKEDLLDVVAVHKASKSTNKIWIGLDDKKKDGTFVWNDGTILAAGSPLWRKGEPNNHGAGEDCVLIRTDDKLNDISCTNKFSVVCQM